MEITRPTIGTKVTVTVAGSDGYDAETINATVIGTDDDSLELIDNGAGLFTIYDADQSTGIAVLAIR